MDTKHNEVAIRGLQAQNKQLEDEVARLTTIIERLVDGTIRTGWNPDGCWAAGKHPARMLGPYETVLEAITEALKWESDYAKALKPGPLLPVMRCGKSVAELLKPEDGNA